MSIQNTLFSHWLIEPFRCSILLLFGCAFRSVCESNATFHILLLRWSMWFFLYGYDWIKKVILLFRIGFSSKQNFNFDFVTQQPIKFASILTHTHTHRYYRKKRQTEYSVGSKLAKHSSSLWKAWTKNRANYVMVFFSLVLSEVQSHIEFVMQSSGRLDLGSFHDTFGRLSTFTFSFSCCVHHFFSRRFQQHAVNTKKLNNFTAYEYIWNFKWVLWHAGRRV